MKKDEKLDLNLSISDITSGSQSPFTVTRATVSETSIGTVLPILEKYSTTLAQKFKDNPNLTFDELSPLEQAKFLAAGKIASTGPDTKTQFASFRRENEKDTITKAEKLLTEQHNIVLMDQGEGAVSKLNKQHVAIQTTLRKIDDWADRDLVTNLEETNPKAYKEFLFDVHMLGAKRTKKDLQTLLNGAVNDPQLAHKRSIDVVPFLKEPESVIASEPSSYSDIAETPTTVSRRQLVATQPQLEPTVRQRLETETILKRSPTSLGRSLVGMGMATAAFAIAAVLIAPYQDTVADLVLSSSLATDNLPSAYLNTLDRTAPAIQEDIVQSMTTESGDCMHDPLAGENAALLSCKAAFKSPKTAAAADRSPLKVETVAFAKPSADEAPRILTAISPQVEATEVPTLDSTGATSSDESNPDFETVSFTQDVGVASTSNILPERQPAIALGDDNFVSPPETSWGFDLTMTQPETKYTAVSLGTELEIHRKTEIVTNTPKNDDLTSSRISWDIGSDMTQPEIPGYTAVSLGTELEIHRKTEIATNTPKNDDLVSAKTSLGIGSTITQPDIPGYETVSFDIQPDNIPRQTELVGTTGYAVAASFTHASMQTPPPMDYTFDEITDVITAYYEANGVTIPQTIETQLALHEEGVEQGYKGRAEMITFEIVKIATNEFGANFFNTHGHDMFELIQERDGKLAAKDLAEKATGHYQMKYTPFTA